MFIKAKANDKDRILDLLKKDPAKALFIAGDILQFGFEVDFQDVYLDEDENGIHGVYLRYRNNLVVYIVDQVIDSESIIKVFEDKTITIISGVKEHMKMLPSRILDQIEQRETYFCECRQTQRTNDLAQKANIDDVEALVDSVMQIEEFTLDKSPREDRIEHLKHQFMHNNKTVFCVKDMNHVVSAASEGVSSDSAMMIVGVYTLKSHRNRGYARACVENLTQNALDRHLVPCLFYDNPNAGQLYHALGYQTFDTWVLGSKK